MNRFFLGSILGLSLTLMLAFSEIGYKPNYSTAEVSKIDGFYVFTESKPILPHDSLGTVDLGFVSGTQYDNIRTNLLKRARKNYPNSDGIILNLNKNGMDFAYVIKFK